MSMQRECRFVEHSPGQWFLMLALGEHGHLGYGYYDCNCYGPFDTLQQAEDYLDRFSNPGGATVYKYPSNDPLHDFLVKHSIKGDPQ